jgi:hypothetical protein
MKITAAQHFFSSVPAAQSPTGRRGYQTIASTPALPAQAVAAIEDRAQYVTMPGDPVKRQFYPLPGALCAVSQITPLAELDEFGRKGRYLAHTLVFAPATFAALEHCPLDVLEQFPFLASLDAVFSQVGPGKGQAPTVTFEITPAWRQQALTYAQRRPASSLAMLGRLTWRASALASQREPVLLIGAWPEQARLLGLLFLLAAPAQRAALSFDTLVEGCNFGPQVTFWAHGYPAPPPDEARHLLDARPDGRIHSSLTAEGDGPFARWMVCDALPAGLAAALPEQPWAATLEDVLLANAPSPGALEQGDAIPQAFIERFARLNSSALVARWIAALPQGLSPELSKLLADHLRVDPANSLRILMDGPHPQDLGEWVFQTLVNLGAAPSAADRKILEPWIKSAAHVALGTLLPYWAGDDKAWVAKMAALDAVDYAYVLEKLAHWPRPLISLTKALPQPERRGLPFLRAAKPGLPPDIDRAVVWVKAVGWSVQAADWGKVMDTLAAIGQPAVDAVAEQVPTLRFQAQHAIAAWLRGYRGEAPALRTALAALNQT